MDGVNGTTPEPTPGPEQDDARAAVLVLRVLVVVAGVAAALGLLVPGWAGVAGGVAVGAVLVGAVGRLPLVAWSWRGGADRRFRLAVGALFAVVVVGTVLGQLLRS
ncbi:MAG: hypothetical protein JJT89_08690 [Nitriliruptoraceae bacterium]|nr:hypothetical protein [Nitriliruptoraceae bacterium]